MIYLINLFFVSLFSLIFDFLKKNGFYFLFFILFISLLPALRSENVGTDTYNYILIFNDYSSINISSLFGGKIEIGYALLNYFSSFFIATYTGFFFIFYFISFYLILDFFRKNSNSIFLSVLVFLCMGLYLSSFNIMRQFLALSICLFSLKYVFERKFFLFFLWVILSSLFHKTSIIFLLVYFVYKYPRFIYLFLLVFLTLVYFLFYNYLDYILVFLGKSSDYSDFGDGAGGGVALIFNGLLYLYFFVLSRFINDDKFKFYLNLFLISIGLIFIFFILQVALSGPMRLIFYFSWATCMLFPLSLKAFKNRAQIFFISLLYFIFLLLYFLSVMNSGYVPNYELGVVF